MPELPTHRVLLGAVAVTAALSLTLVVPLTLVLAFDFTATLALELVMALTASLVAFTGGGFEGGGSSISGGNDGLFARGGFCRCFGGGRFRSGAATGQRRQTRDGCRGDALSEFEFHDTLRGNNWINRDWVPRSPAL